jgi:hypothetical protein
MRDSIIGLALAWAGLTPVMCKAQTEIAPDHYEMTNVEPFAQPTNAATANGGSMQKQIGGGGGGNDDQRRANIYYHSAPPGASTRARTARARSWRTESERIDRLWKQISVKLNDLSARFLAAWVGASTDGQGVRLQEFAHSVPRDAMWSSTTRIPAVGYPKK